MAAHTCSTRRKQQCVGVPATAIGIIATFVYGHTVLVSLLRTQDISARMLWLLLYPCQACGVVALSSLAALHNVDPGLVRNLADRGAGAKPCVVCNELRPPGSHHCRTCDHCVAGFDHHCIWLGVCIGLGNQRFFIALLLSGAVAFAHIIVGAIVCLRWELSTRRLPSGLPELVAPEWLALSLRYGAPILLLAPAAAVLALAGLLQMLLRAHGKTAHSARTAGAIRGILAGSCAAVCGRCLVLMNALASVSLLRCCQQLLEAAHRLHLGKGRKPYAVLQSLIAVVLVHALTIWGDAGWGGAAILSVVLGCSAISSRATWLLLFRTSYRLPPAVPLLQTHGRTQACGTDDVGWCERCRQPQPPLTAHCNAVACNRCIPGRDHHCQLYDCCIGDHNRRLHMANLGAAMVGTTPQLLRCVADLPPRVTELWALLPHHLKGLAAHPLGLQPLRTLQPLVAIGVTLFVAGLWGMFLIFMLQQLVYLAYAEEVVNERVAHALYRTFGRKDWGALPVRCVRAVEGVAIQPSDERAEGGEEQGLLHAAAV